MTAPAIFSRSIIVLAIVGLNNWRVYAFHGTSPIRLHFSDIAKYNYVPESKIALGQHSPTLNTKSVVHNSIETNFPERGQCIRRSSYLQMIATSSRSRSFSSETAKINPTNNRKRTRVTEYDADAICDHYDMRPLQVGWRLNSLGLPMLGWYFTLLMDKTLGFDKHEAVHRKRGRELKNILINSKSVALVKSGQAASLRPDLMKNKIWAEELSKLVDAVGSFSDLHAMEIISSELADISPRVEAAMKKKTSESKSVGKLEQRRKLSKLDAKVKSDPVLNLFDFSNDKRAVASASIGQVYKARLRSGPLLEAAIGKEEAFKWGGKTVAVKVQRPDAAGSAALDMYLLRRAAVWLSKFRGGDLPAIADQFGEQLFGELDYVREADSCERFRALYGGWEDVAVPAACLSLSRKKVLVQEWMEGQKGPWDSKNGGYEMVKTGLRCSVNQLMNTGLFHADPHRGNLLKTKDDRLGFIDFGMMMDVDEDERYGLIGLAIGLQDKNLDLITEKLLELGFLEDTTQLNLLVPRLRQALLDSTGGTGKASNVNFASLQANLDEISRENVLKFKTPPFFTTILRSLTILEGFALNVDSNFRLVRGSYPYVLAQLLSENGGQETPEGLTKLLIRLLTVDGKGERIEWERLRDFLRLAQKASKKDSSLTAVDSDDNANISRETISLFYKFLTSKTGLFLKAPLVHEIAEAIDGMASVGEANLLRLSNGLIRPLPGGNGPINARRMEEVRGLLAMAQSALAGSGDDANRSSLLTELLQGLVTLLSDDKRREEAGPIFAEVQSVFQMVFVEVLEVRGSRALRNIVGGGERRVGGVAATA